MSELRELLLSKKSFSWIPRSPEIMSRLVEETKFLDDVYESEEIPVVLRCRCVIDRVASVPMCTVCNSSHVRIVKQGSKFSEYCSIECGNNGKGEKAKKVFIEKYGVDNPNKLPSVREKTAKTCLGKYGSECVLESPEIKKRIKKTCIERYGDEIPSKSREVSGKIKESLRGVHAARGGQIREQTKRTCQERYGVDHPSNIPGATDKTKRVHVEKYGSPYLSSDECKRKRVDVFGSDNFFTTQEFKDGVRKKNQERFGTNHHLQDKLMFDALGDKDWLLSEYKSKTITQIALELSTTPSTVWRYLNQYGVLNSEHGATGRSALEQELLDFITDIYDGCIETNVRNVITGELDIYLPDAGLAFEFNGIFWHSERFKNTTYHQNKSLMCKEKDILLIHIWEDDWLYKRDIVEAKIKSKLHSHERVFARKCEGTVVTGKEAMGFYKETHIQGGVGATNHFGLSHNGELVACVSMKKKSEKTWELVRYATKYAVIGGLGKLLKIFKKTVDGGELITFAHLDYSHGDLYEKTGFELVKITRPGMWYIKNGRRERREKYMKHKLSGILPNFNESLTERENMANAGYTRLFDSGSIKYRMPL